ncbi:MAG: UDP-N-acetylmuramate--L-alanine ligase [Oscillospiraceae bacterium]|nr:UDP-N-acetylmuramate--L-alanine ligase [Oscillospiraceae bacterium]
MEFSQFEQHINSGQRCHLVGIGGVSMSPLAEILYGMGINITGSDINDSPAVERLRSIGIKVVVGHSPENVRGAGVIIRTAAARENNIEIKTARELGIPVYERAQAWGHVMLGYKNAVCVSGVHGKTTTTSMVTHIMLSAKRDPTVMIGGTLPTLGSGYRVGQGDVIVVESCEYYNSFHCFFPTVAVVLNVDADHLDFFKDINDLQSSFRKFASLVPEGGHIICNGDDENTMKALAPLSRELFTFGFGANARLRGINVCPAGRNPSMDVVYDGVPFCGLTLQIPGVHNLLNALAATSAAVALGVSAAEVEEGLQGYEGVSRRFEFKGVFNGADVYDDYAHHPSELRATLDAVSTLGYKRIILVFQPHTFSRTKALFSDFVSVLSRADVTFIAEIYAAREKNDIGITSDVLAAAIPGARCLSDFQEIATEIAKIACKGDIVLTAGAGDIHKVGETLLAINS